MEDKVKLTVESAVWKQNTTAGGKYSLTIKFKELPEPMELIGFATRVAKLVVSLASFVKKQDSSTYFMLVTFKRLRNKAGFFGGDFSSDNYVFTGEFITTIG
jgi:hypothetical protein